MRKLNVKRVEKWELAEKWGFEIPYSWPSPLYIRCNSKGEVKWDKSPVYFAEDLVERGNYFVFK